MITMLFAYFPTLVLAAAFAALVTGQKPRRSLRLLGSAFFVTAFLPLRAWEVGHFLIGFSTCGFLADFLFGVANRIHPRAKRSWDVAVHLMGCVLFAGGIAAYIAMLSNNDAQEVSGLLIALTVGLLVISAILIFVGVPKFAPEFLRRKRTPDGLAPAESNASSLSPAGSDDTVANASDHDQRRRKSERGIDEMGSQNGLRSTTRSAGPGPHDSLGQQ